MTCVSVLAYGYRGTICRIGTFDVADLMVMVVRPPALRLKRDDAG
jgi:hypothetical protein